MRVPFFVLDQIDNARRLGRHQWLLRSIMVVGVFLVLLAARLAGSSVGVVAVTLVLAGAVWAAAVPDSTRPALVVAALLVLWLVVVDSRASGWSLLAALGVLVVHTSASYAAEMPPGGRASQESYRRWALHAGVVAVVTTAFWVLEQGVELVDAPGRVILTGLALLAAMATAVTLAKRSVPDRAGE